MNLMIVDDEKILRNGFKHMTDWEAKGIHIINEAFNGQDALDKIRLNQPDVVLTDIKMPVMNGIELTKRIKENYPSIQVIVLSGYDDYPYVRESMKYGAMDYLLKASVDAEEIIEILGHMNQHYTSSKNTDGYFPGEAELSTTDRQQLKELLKNSQYEDLKIFIENTIDKVCDLPISYIKNLMRDLFYYIQFQLEQYGLPYKFTREVKVQLSLDIEAITNACEAKHWCSIFIEELQQLGTEGKVNGHIRHVIDLIDSSYQQPGLSLASIADHMHLNKNYLCDLFKAETGSTINQYIAKVRINHSKELMRNTSMTLNEIALSIGYSDYNYFSRVFRKNMGVPPSKYHQMY